MVFTIGELMNMQCSSSSQQLLQDDNPSQQIISVVSSFISKRPLVLFKKNYSFWRKRRSY